MHDDERMTGGDGLADEGAFDGGAGQADGMTGSGPAIPARRAVAPPARRAPAKRAVKPSTAGTGGKTPAKRARPSTRRPAAKGRRAPVRTIVRWSAAREELFLAALAETANVTEGVRRSGLSETNVRRRRQKDEDFRARWSAALREGFERLEGMLLERALNGVEKAVWHGGKQVGKIREYSDRLALSLLAAHRPAVMGAEAARTTEQMRAELALELEEMHRRMRGEG